MCIDSTFLSQYKRNKPIYYIVTASNRAEQWLFLVTVTLTNSIYTPADLQQCTVTPRRDTGHVVASQCWKVLVKQRGTHCNLCGGQITLLTLTVSLLVISDHTDPETVLAALSPTVATERTTVRCEIYFIVFFSFY